MHHSTFLRVFSLQNLAEKKLPFFSLHKVSWVWLGWHSESLFLLHERGDRVTRQKWSWPLSSCSPLRTSSDFTFKLYQALIWRFSFQDWPTCRNGPFYTSIFGLTLESFHVGQGWLLSSINQQGEHQRKRQAQMLPKWVWNDNYIFGDEENLYWLNQSLCGVMRSLTSNSYAKPT